MTAKINYKDTDSLTSYLVIGLAFSIPVSVALTNLILVLILIVFLYERKFKERFEKIKSNPIVYFVLGIVLIHIIGFSYSDNLSMAGTTFKQIKKLLYIPFLMMFVKREHILYYLQAFVLGMMISEALTYLVWLDILSPFMHADHEMPSPLMKHTFYTPYVAMASALIVYFLLYKKHKTLVQKTVTGIFLTTMLFNLFMSGGRGGQVGFLVLFLVLIMYLYRDKLLKGLVIFAIGSTIIFSIAYSYIPLFQERADKAVHEVITFNQGQQTTSVGIRLGLYKNYFEIFKENPIFGVGTGDYLDEYEKVNARSNFKTPIFHPHNMYLLFAVQFGVIGLLLFLSLFIYQLYVGFKIKDDLQVWRIAFPLFFLIIMTVHWYLYSFNTMMLFIVFSAIFYARYDDKVRILD